jgi:hypothetical protein
MFTVSDEITTHYQVTQLNPQAYALMMQAVVTASIHLCKTLVLLEIVIIYAHYFI